MTIVLPLSFRRLASRGTGSLNCCFEELSLHPCPAVVCAFIVVWLGAATQTYLWTYHILSGFLMAPLWLRRYFFLPEIPFSQTAGFVALCVFLAFLLMRRTLMCSSRAYRIFPSGQANPFGGLGWGLGR